MKNKQEADEIYGNFIKKAWEDIDQCEEEELSGWDKTCIVMEYTAEALRLAGYPLPIMDREGHLAEDDNE